MPCQDITRRGVLRGATAGALGAYGLSNIPPGVRALETETRQSSGEGGLLLGGPEDKGYAAAEATPSLNLPEGSALTIECWVRHDGNSQENGIIVDKSKNGSGYQLKFLGGGEQPRLDFGVNDVFRDYRSVYSNSGIPAGTWTHIAATYDKSKLELYINGELDATSGENNGIPDTDAPLVLGANSAKNDRFFSGEIDEVRIWNSARELLEIEENMFTRLSGDEDDLMAYWPFDGSLDDQAKSNNLETAGSAAMSGRGTFPTAPLLYTRAGDGAVDLQWEPRGAEAQGVSEYRLYHGASIDGSDRTQVTTYDSGTTSGTVNAANDQTHFFWITAVDGDGNESGFSYPAIAFPSTSPSGRAVEFPGDDSYITVDDRPEIDAPNNRQLTIEFWVNHDGESDENAIILTKGSQYRVNFRGTGSGVRIDFGVEDAFRDYRSVYSNGGVPKNEWTHVACTYNGSKLAVYINGELDNEASEGNGVGSTSEPLRFGTNPDTNKRFFSGQLDQIRIWNTFRTKEQIQETYKSELFGNEEGLAGYWRTCDGETLYGSVGTAMTGAFNNIGCGKGDFELENQSTESESNPSAADSGGDGTPSDGGDGTPSDGEDGGGSQGTSGPAQDQGTPTPGGGGDDGRGFLFNGEQSVLGFVNETIITVVGIVFSVFGILYQMVGGER